MTIHQRTQKSKPISKVLGDFKVAYYKARGRQPGARGYWTYSTRFIDATLRDTDVLETFVRGGPLPNGFGHGLGERCVEYPWVFAQIPAGDIRIVDAGSVFNYDFVVNQPKLRDKSITCVTLAPEDHCFYRQGVAYLFEDLRNLPLRENTYDLVVSISTIEHIGLDNTRYIADDRYNEEDPASFKQAIREFNRILKPGGRLLVTVPFGKHQVLDWLQQFDTSMIKALENSFDGMVVEETYFRYTEAGWDFSDASSCANAEYYDGQRPRFAKANAVACVALEKIK